MSHPGLIIAQFRTGLHITQSELSKQCGCSRAYLARIETERQEPSLKFLDTVAKVLRVPTGLLLLHKSDLPNGKEYQPLATFLDALIDLRIQKTHVK